MSFVSALVAVGLLTLATIMVEVFFVYGTKGFGHGFSSNRPTDGARSALGTRIERAYRNQVETNAYAVPVIAAAAIVGLESGSAEIAALVHVIARAAFAPLYYTGIPFARVPAWGLGWMSLAWIAVEVIRFGAVFS